MSRETLRAGLPPLGAADGQALGALAFGSSAGGASALGRSLAFLPLEALELDLSDPEQRDFGDYELLEQLGQGGMGVVYRAHQRSLDRDVALKLLAAGPWAAPAFIERFRAEAQSAARLRHPNIVPVYEIGSHAELNFFSMGLVEGESLDWRLAREGPLAGREAARLVRRVAEAVDYAHRFGILHLDLKPANILIEAHSGEPMVADFGLAKRLDATLSDTAGDVSGTPSYMAPEQARGEAPALGMATDVYGLGAVLYELLCGRPPFLGATARETLRRVAEAPLEAPGALRDGVDADLDAICLRCLARDPAARYPSARALADDLGRYLDGHPVSARPLGHWQRGLRWARREPRVALAALAALLALGLGALVAGLQWQRADAAAWELRAALWQKRGDDAGGLLQRGERLAALPDLVANLVEQEAVGAGEEAARSRLRLGTLLDQTPALVDVLSAGSFVQQVLLDRQGAWVAVLAGNGDRAQLYDLRTGSLRWQKRVVLGGHATTLEASSDPRFLISQVVNFDFPVRRGMQNYLVDLASGDLVEPPADRFPNLFKRHFSRDGSHALIVQHAAEAGGAPLGRLVRVADWSVLGPGRTLPGMALMAGDGRHFAYRATLVEERDDPVPVELIDARSMQTRWRHQPGRGAALRAWHFVAAGERLAMGFEDGRVGLFDSADGAVTWLASASSAAPLDFHLSADESWLAAVHADGAIQLWDARDGSSLMQPLRPESGERGWKQPELDLHPEARSLYAQDRNASWLWVLPPGNGPVQAVPVATGIPQPVQVSTNAAVVPLGLFATGASDGQVRLWRGRGAAPVAATAPPQAVWNANRRFDGRHALHVEGTWVQQRGLAGGLDGVRMQFERPVVQAMALPDGGTVLVAAGNELHARSGSSGEPVWPPIRLDATPSALLLSDDGRRALLAWNAHDNERSWLGLLMVDTGTGAVLGTNRLDHPSWLLRLAADGSALVASRFDRVQVFEGDSLGLRWGPLALSRQEASSPVRGMEIGRDGQVLWLSTGRGGADGYGIHALDARSGAILQSWIAPAWAASLQSLANGRQMVALIPNVGRLQRFTLGETAVRWIPLALSGQGRSIMASADERRLLVLSERGAQWVGLPELDWLSPLAVAADADVPYLDARLDAQGQVALVQDRERRQWRLEARPEARTASELRQLAELLVPGFDQEREPMAAPPPPAWRAALRASDPGPPPPLPAPILADAVRPRPQGGEVDLGPQCNLPLSNSHRVLYSEPRLDRILPPGRHRLAGVEFLVQCAVLARYAPQSGPSVEAGSRVEGIALPDPHAQALELLLMGASRLLDPGEDHFGTLELRYRDGSVARQNLRLGHDLDPWFFDDPENRWHRQRVAYAALGHRPDGAIGAPPHMYVPLLHALRLANPHPERALDSLAIESTRHAWSTVVLLAVTSVPAGSRPAQAEAATPSKQTSP